MSAQGQDQKAVFDAFMSVHKAFLSEYGVLWAKSDPVEQERWIQEWLSELVRSGVSARSIKIVHRLICTDPRFSTYPPKRRSFIRGAAAIQEMEEGGEDLILFRRVFDLFLDFSYRFGALWPRRAIDEEISAARVWTGQLCARGVGPDDIDAGVKSMDEDGEYASRPPTMAQFRRLCMRRAAPPGEAPPRPDEAYRQACAGNHETLHPAVVAARKSVGAYRLRTASTERTRGEFMKAYEKSVEDFLSRRHLDGGDAELDDFAPTPSVGGENEDSELMPPDEMLGFLDEIMASRN